MSVEHPRSSTYNAGRQVLGARDQALCESRCGLYDSRQLTVQRDVPQCSHAVRRRAQHLKLRGSVRAAVHTTYLHALHVRVLAPLERTVQHIGVAQVALKGVEGLSVLRDYGQHGTTLHLRLEQLSRVSR
jgi:hypothetical protein